MGHEAADSNVRSRRQLPGRKLTHVQAAVSSVFDPTRTLRVVHEALARQQIIGRAPARQLRHAIQPSVYRRMAVRAEDDQARGINGPLPALQIVWRGNSDDVQGRKSASDQA